MMTEEGDWTPDGSYYCHRCGDWKLRAGRFEHFVYEHDVDPESGKSWSDLQNELRLAFGHRSPGIVTLSGGEHSHGAA